jgi:hypothetical protein
MFREYLLAEDQMFTNAMSLIVVIVVNQKFDVWE